jgi:hypothetical protein
LPIQSRIAAAMQDVHQDDAEGDTGGLMIRLIVNGRMWWMVKGCLYSTLAAAITARDSG